MNLEIIMIVANLVLGFIFIRYLRNQDFYDPEPFLMIALATVVGGVVSVFSTLLINSLLAKMGVSHGATVVNAYLLIGPIEEASKFIGFISFLRLFKIKLDEPVDAVIYISAVALGFALIENYFYGLKSITTFTYRSFLTAPVHIVFSIPMALSYMANVKSDTFKMNLLRAFLISAFLHATYDALLFVGINLGFYIILAITFYYGKKIFGYTLLSSPHRKSLKYALLREEQTKSFHCIVCKEENLHHVHKFQNTILHECTECTYVVMREKEAQKFIGYFLPYLNRKNHQWNQKIDDSFVTVTDHKFDSHRRFAIEQSTLTIEEIAEEMKQDFEKGMTFNLIFSKRPEKFSALEFSENSDQISKQIAKHANVNGALSLYKISFLIILFIMVTLISIGFVAYIAKSLKGV